MNILLKTGFDRISHSINFQPETPKKGKALAECGRLHEVIEHRTNEIILIECKVIRQASVSSTPYTTKLLLDSERQIIEVKCTCVYNKSNKCKHVAALIYYINNDISATKTSEEQQWGKPTVRQSTLEKYSKGKFFEQMFPKVNHPVNQELKRFPPQLNELSRPSHLRNVLLEMARDKNEFAVKAVMSELLKNVEKIEKKNKNDGCIEVCLDNFFIFSTEHQIYTNNLYCNVDAEVKNFYVHNVIKSKKEIVKICCDTVEQSQTQEWFQCRQLRISASSNVHSIKSRDKKSVDSLVSDMLYPKKVNVRSTKYGTKHENMARKLYQKLYNCEVQQVGLIINHLTPFLCASLDGVVLKDGVIIKIVEFKCPSSCEKKPIVDFTNRSSNVSCLKSGTLQLKESDKYYTQCQVQMYVSGMDYCDLFLYSPIENGSFVVEVARDEKFLQKVILKSELFYFQYYLPALYALVNKRNSENAKANNVLKRTFTGKDIKNL